MGTRTVSLPWLNRIAAALGCTPADLVTLPIRETLPVAALLGPRGAVAPRSARSVSPPCATPGMLAVTVSGAVGDYRAGDELWCEPLGPDRFADAMNRDILVPRAAGGYVFARLAGVMPDALHLLPLEPGAAGDGLRARLDRARGAIGAHAVIRALLPMVLVLALPAAAPPQATPAPVAPTPAPIEKPVLVHAFPHDPTAFTEGLLIADGTLYESTGREGRVSSARSTWRPARRCAARPCPTACSARASSPGAGVAQRHLAWRARFPLEPPGAQEAGRMAL